jgi:hypothetical protein
MKMSIYNKYKSGLSFTDAQEKKPYRFKFKPDANSIRKYLVSADI